MSEERKADNLHEKIEVTISMTRGELNKLTHAMATEPYDLAIRRACWEKITGFRSPIANLESSPYSKDTDIEDD